MPDIFESNVSQRDAAPEMIEVLREAYMSASETLGLANGVPENRLALLVILREVASVEVFRKPSDMAQLAVDLYRARRG